MNLPSTRELELETLLRTRDIQLTELTDELTHLRQFLASQPGPSTSNPVTLPPALVSVLLPHLNKSPYPTASTSGSNTVNAALIQRARSLQEENDELYDLLKQSETGKLKEEVRSLRRVVVKLESALKDSHRAISSLSSELDKSYDTFMSSVPINNVSHRSQSPRAGYYTSSRPPMDSGNGMAASKPTPTGPRAHKKARLSESTSQGSPPLGRAHPSLGPPSAPAAVGTHKRYGRSHSSSRGTDTREYPPRRSGGPDGRGPEGRINHRYQKMDLDGDQQQQRQQPLRQQQQQRARPSSPMQERDRDRDRDRRGRDRDRESERGNGPSHRSHRRNGGGRGGRRYDHGQVSANNESMHTGDRTLRERISGL